MVSCVKHSFPLIVLHGLGDPVQVLGYSGVHAVIASFPTVDSPANNSSCPVAFLVLQHQSPPAVSLARVLSALREAGTEHVTSEDRDVTVAPPFLINRGAAFLLVH